MVHEPTLRKLQKMRLSAMADSYQNQLLDSNYQALSFEERFGLLVDTEWSRRKNNRLSSLIRKADFQISDAHRIVHSSYTITIKGMDSMRKRKGIIN